MAWGFAVVAAPNAAMVGLAVLASWICGVLMAGRKIQTRPVVTATRRYELGFASLTVLISGLIGAMTVYLVERRLIVLSFERPSAATAARELVGYFLAFDLYFYAVHRFLHLGPLFRWVHFIHHRSVAPNPLSAFSAHPVETLLTGCFPPLFWICVPLHAWTILVISLYYGAATTAFHTGYDVFPRWWHRRSFSKWYLTPQYHDLHHARGRFNYGGYTVLWDWVFGTVAPEFRSDRTPAAGPYAERPAEAS